MRIFSLTLELAPFGSVHLLAHKFSERAHKQAAHCSVARVGRDRFRLAFSSTRYSPPWSASSRADCRPPLGGRTRVTGVVKSR